VLPFPMKLIGSNILDIKSGHLKEKASEVDKI